MALIDQVRRIVNRLAPRGWEALLARHGLRLRAPNLARELGRVLPDIDRNIDGFRDFTRAGRRAIEPGKPAASLLYHALASPDVHPTPRGRRARPEDYPTLDDLDVIENYIYSLRREEIRLVGDDLMVAVFAYQYRPGSHSPHGYHADLAFSRTGLARVGTRGARYDPAKRSFWPVPRGAGNAVALMPARYGVFLARERTTTKRDPVLGRRREDAVRTFLFPVHKLFPGTECVRDADVRIDFTEYHRTEKLNRIHAVAGIELAAGFRLDEPPFVRDSRTSRDLVDLQPVGAAAQPATVLLVPRRSNEMVRYATQFNDRSRRNEIVRFVVPKENDDSGPENRYVTSLEIEPEGEGVVRNAPEYVNIRHQVHRADAARPRVEDLNGLEAGEFARRLRRGGYEAAHFVDDTCEGVVGVSVRGLPRVLPERPAYSLVTAPDFFPLADQVEIARWVRNLPDREHFEEGAPDPLSEGRRPINPALHHPGRPSERAFAAEEETVVAVLGTPPLSRGRHAVQAKKQFVSFLPDGGSNEFAPGWDVSLGGDDEDSFYAAYGLGSPFPEDVKLCAALNSYWPAVAPDAARTFRGLYGDARDKDTMLHTAIPLLDEELGYHPRHPKVRQRVVHARRGWDGEYGPFFEPRGRTLWINYADIERSDYVGNLRTHGFDLRFLAPLDSPELIARMQKLRDCIAALGPADDMVSDSSLWLVTAEKIRRWEDEPSRASPSLKEPGYLFVFASVDGDGNPTREEPTRRRVRVRQMFTCHIGWNQLYHRTGDGPWRKAR
jgi:hypothetical protein